MNLTNQERDVLRLILLRQQDCGVAYLLNIPIEEVAGIRQRLMEEFEVKSYLTELRRSFGKKTLLSGQVRRRPSPAGGHRS